MQRYRATVVGSFPRPAAVADTMKRPSLAQPEIDDLIRWAVAQQVGLGLEIITDGEGYRENMYYYYQKRMDGVSMENMVPQSFGPAGFTIECARVVGTLANPRFHLAHNWKVAREAAPAGIVVKQTVTGPHMLTRFSLNERPDLYPDEQALCRAYANILRQELNELIAAGCEHIQFDEPAWTESPQQSEWAVDILNELIDSLNRVRIGLHVCGGNPRRKRVYFTKYTDLAPAFRKAHIHEVLLEHCTLGYNLMDLWKLWDFKGDLGLGVIDQRSDVIETPDVIRQRLQPALEYFPPERLLLTSECGFGHVPVDITRAKLSTLTRTSRELGRAASA
ncbi:MAG: cobalamin-independent methionine synthase II family protein [Acidobacteriaceae bacterium]|nr:cobalamin-independent methionine synthase II family protein [Acidobacteriaceae bacterium]MBV9780083.1 cobalamin-independent methionine synthase II family protein [Acidobacteriaceae bacterium]